MAREIERRRDWYTPEQFRRALRTGYRPTVETIRRWCRRGHVLKRVRKLGTRYQIHRSELDEWNG